MLSRPGNSKFLQEINNSFFKQANLADYLFCDVEKANLSQYPTNDIWHCNGEKIVRTTKSYIKEVRK